MGQKQQVVLEIARTVGVQAPHMSTGSTEPKAIFELVNDALGLGIDGRLTKPTMAECICGAAGVMWDDTCFSTGSTVTLVGLNRVLQAVRVLTGDALSLEQQA